MASFPAMRYKSGRIRPGIRPGGKILDPEGFAMPAHRTLRLAGSWAAVFLMAMLSAVAVRAAAPPYEVTGVEVDVTASDAATARDQAIVEGQRKAFTMLMERLLGAEQAATIPTPSDAELSSMVQDFEVESERLSSVRYIGVMTYRFDAASIDAAMGRPTDTTGGIVTDAVPSGPIRTLNVVVPITSLRDWVEVRRRLSGITLVQRAEVRSLARTEGELNLSYYGDEARLRQALAQRQLSLLQDPQQQQWVLQLGTYGGATTGNP